MFKIKGQTMLAFAVLVGFGALAHAGEGRVCTSERSKPNELMKPLEAKTSFTCEGIEGSHTISALYTKGWTVAQVVPASNTADGRPFTYWVIVIEKK